MATALKLLGAALIALAAVGVVAGFRAGAVDIPDGVILVGALALLTRTAIRTASDTTRTVADASGRRRRHQ